MSDAALFADFSIKTEVYEGPLDLLIELVEKRKLLINDINLATVTDEYMQRVSDMQERSLPNTAEFVRLAATLLLIKSKSLLPVLELSAEEETAIEDLQDRLKQYQVYKEAGVAIAQRFGKHQMYPQRFVPPTEPVFHPDEYCSQTALSEAIWRVLRELPVSEFKPKVAVTKTISLEEMIGNLKQRIERQMRTQFSELRQYGTDRKTVAISFLAVLELVKQGEVLAEQSHMFADFAIERNNNGAPRYY